jgi:hypothetical protein
LVGISVEVNHMWTPEEVEQMKRSAAFGKEYNLKFGYETSTIFNAHDIDFITSDSYDSSDETCTSPYFTKWLAIDPGWGGSNSFVIVIVQWKDQKLEAYADKKLILVDQPLERIHIGLISIA